MPKGIPRSGFRHYKKKGIVPVTGTKMRELQAQRDSGMTFFEGPMRGPIDDPDQVETDEQILKRLDDRFEVLGELAQDACNGGTRALIVAGPAGLGKSYTVEQVIKKYNIKCGDEKTAIRKGFTRASGMFKTAYQYKDEGCVTVYDDCDSVFLDEDALNLLKSACDTTEQRRLYWGAESRMMVNEELVPDTFDYNGSIIFITNFDMDEAINRGHRLTPHFQALMSRAHYIDLKIKTKRDYLVQIQRVVDQGMLRDRGINAKDEDIIMEYVRENADMMREITLRSVLKVADIYKSHRSKWVKIAGVTVLRGG